MQAIRASLGSKSRRFAVRELLTGRLRKVMIFGFGIAFFQQATGINAVFYYLPTIFGQSGGELSTRVRPVGVRRTGQRGHDVRGDLADRPAGAQAAAVHRDRRDDDIPVDHRLGVTRSAAPGSHSGVVLIAIAAFVASFAVSLGPVMWVMLSEIFPNEERAAAISAVGFWNSLVSASVTLIFPKELATWGPAGTFLGYGLLAAAGLVFVLLLAPETKGKSLEELEGMLAGRNRLLAIEQSAMMR